ncbi:MAG: hypothetical protein IPG11_09985 [Flavobacteriales bacterium]|nr:hypothetical protein [Flavobacteriales bacterium]
MVHRFPEPIPNDNGSCVSFVTAAVQPPVITENTCSQTYTQPNGPITISWTFGPIFGYVGEIEYVVNIVQFDPEFTVANEAVFDNAGPWLYSATTTALTLNLQPEDLVQYGLPGGKYAVRVRAQAPYPDSPIPVDHDGYSAVCEFTSRRMILRRPVRCALSIRTTGLDPFNFIPIIAKFEPEGALYSRFNFHTWVDALDETPSLPERADYDLWPNGPVVDQGLSDQDGAEHRASLLPIYFAKVNMPAGAAFQRGGSYRWHTTGDLRLPNSTWVHGDTGEEPFHIGMGPSVPEAPANGATVPRGPVELRWKTADLPDRLAPPGDIVQLDGIHGSTRLDAFDGWVDEHWKLEVSRSPEFTDIFYQTDGAIGSAVYDIVYAIEHPVDFENTIYPELNAQVTATEDGTYYWRLKWLRDPNDATAGTYNESAVFSFIVGSGTPTPPTGTPTEEPTAEEACVANCNADLPTDVSPGTGGVHVNDVLDLGRFKLVVKTVSISAPYTGTGTIEIPFLNHLKMQVDFEGLRANALLQVYEGTAKAKRDHLTGTIAKVQSSIGYIPGLSAAEKTELSAAFEDTHRLVSGLVASAEIGLPIGIDREVAGRQVVLGIVNMEFAPTRAFLDIVGGVDLPELNTSIFLGLGDVCIGPSGFAGEMRAYMADTLDVAVGGMTYRLNGGASTSLANLTYMDWDCHGFKCLQMAGGIGFPRTSIIPSPDNNKQVFAHFSVKMCTGWDFLAKVSMDPFEPTGAADWVLTVDSMWWDFSSAENPTGLTFPTGYDHAALSATEPGLLPTWKGFYMPRVSMTAPRALNDGGPLQWYVDNVFIDNTGITLNASAVHLVDIGHGNLSGWAFSLDSIWLDVLQDRFGSAGLKGKLGMPIFREQDALAYSAVVAYIPETEPPPPDQPADHTGATPQTGLTFNLKVEADRDLTVPMWIAEVRLEENSKVELEIGDDTYLRADLSGKLTINTANQHIVGLPNLPEISLDLMQFENLVLDSDNGMSCGECTAFSFASPKHSIAGLPISVDSIGLDFSDATQPKLFVRPVFSLGGGTTDFSAKAGITFNAVLPEGDIKRFSFATPPVSLQEVIIENAQIAGMTLDGHLSIINEPGRDGIDGGLSVTMPMGFHGEFRAMFGSVHTDTSKVYNSSAENYGYWYVDGSVFIPSPGFPLFGGVIGVYGFAGGAWYNVAISTEPNSVGDGSVYHGMNPHAEFNSLFGLHLGLTLGTCPDPSAVNMDANVIAEISTHGGLTRMQFTGDLWGLRGFAERANAPIKGGLRIEYRKDGTGAETVTGNVTVLLDMGIVHGDPHNNNLLCEASFHTGPDGWFFKMGEPKMHAHDTEDKRAALYIGLFGMEISAHAYIMVGNKDVPTELPELPDLITEILGASNSGDHGRVEETADASDVDSGERRGAADMRTGAGFAFGAEIAVNIPELNLVILYAKLDGTIGFDLNLTQQTMQCASLNGDYTPGSNGWYAQGQFYAGLRGEVGIQLPLIFTTIRIPIVEMGAAMVLSGNLPNPFGFRGEAGLYFKVLGCEGRARLRVEAGERCVLVNNDPLAGMRFIQEVKPNSNPSSIYDLPTATFTRGMSISTTVGPTFTVPRSDDGEGNITTYTFRPYLKTFEVAEMNGTSYTNLTGFTPRYSGDSLACIYLDRTVPLNGRKKHRIKITVRVQEEVGASWRDYAKDDVVWHEDTTVFFTTGVAPDTIPESVVDYTYPVNKQRFHLQGESNNKGAIKVRMTVSDAFPATVIYHKKPSPCSYRARFVPVNGGATVESPVTYTTGQTVPLTIPTLMPEQVYICQIIRRRNLSGQEIAAQTFSSDDSATTAAVNASQQNNLTLVAHLHTLDSSFMNVTSASGTLVQAKSLADNEHLVYQFSFRTSKYNTLQQKLAAVQLKGTTPSPCTFGVTYADVTGHTEEGLDEFDLHGVWKNGVRKLLPLLGMDGLVSGIGMDDYYRYLDGRMYDLTLNCGYDTYYSFPNGEHVTVSPPSKYLFPGSWSHNYPDYPLISYCGTVETQLTAADLSSGPPAGASISTTNSAPNPWLGLIVTGLGGVTNGPFASVPSNGVPSGVNIPLVQNLQLKYGGRWLASRDLLDIKDRASLALWRRSSPGNPTPRTLQSLLEQFDQGEQVCLSQLSTMPYEALRYITYNEPKPAQEFNTTESAVYHVKLGYTAPIPGSQNTSVSLPFTLYNKALPDVYNNTVLGTMY